jgi:hypothetical protein
MSGKDKGRGRSAARVDGDKVVVENVNRVKRTQAEPAGEASRAASSSGSADARLEGAVQPGHAEGRPRRHQALPTASACASSSPTK